jgi:hypothetical protein
MLTPSAAKTQQQKQKTAAHLGGAFFWSQSQVPEMPGMSLLGFRRMA